MRVLFVGLGSVGQRHLRNLKKMLGEEVELLAYRKTKHNMLIVDGKGEECESLEQYYGVRTIENMKDAFKEPVDAVFVTNPSSKHIDTHALLDF